MPPTLSKTQIDKLGGRLKKGPLTDDDLRLLDEYRLSFSLSFETVLQKISRYSQFPMQRRAKSKDSIIAKLRRESIRLSQVQDIAGCRVFVENLIAQDQIAELLKVDFPQATVTDRRTQPSYGYRAVHVIAEVFNKPVEIQIRTTLQHMWAEISEKACDVIDPAIKYGGGPSLWRAMLHGISENIYSREMNERFLMQRAPQSQLAERELKERMSAVRESEDSTRETMAKMLSLLDQAKEKTKE